MTLLFCHLQVLVNILSSTIQTGGCLEMPDTHVKMWLLTPLENVTSERESNYQTCHVKTRNTIERCNGLLKQRFRCLRNGILFEPRNACVVLHNIALMHNQAVPRTDERIVEENEAIEDNEHNNHVNNNNDAVSGRELRRELIQNMI